MLFRALRVENCGGSDFSRRGAEPRRRPVCASCASCGQSSRRVGNRRRIFRFQAFSFQRFSFSPRALCDICGSAPIDHRNEFTTDFAITRIPVSVFQHSTFSDRFTTRHQAQDTKVDPCSTYPFLNSLAWYLAAGNLEQPNLQFSASAEK